MALSKILKNRQLLRESLSLRYWTVMMLSIEKFLRVLKRLQKKANIDVRQNNWTFRGWKGMHDALIHYPISPFEKSRYSTIPLKQKNNNNKNRKWQKNPSSFFLHRGNRHFTIPQKGMGEWRVENGRTTDSKDKISVTLVFSFGFFLKVPIAIHKYHHLFLSHFCSKIIGKKRKFEKGLDDNNSNNNNNNIIIIIIIGHLKHFEHCQKI